MPSTPIFRVLSNRSMHASTSRTSVSTGWARWARRLRRWRSTPRDWRATTASASAREPTAGRPPAAWARGSVGDGIGDPRAAACRGRMTDVQTIQSLPAANGGRIMLMRNRVGLAMFTLVLCAGGATAADVQLPANLPHRKPGLWVQQVTTQGHPSVTEKICLDEATDAALYKFGLGASNAMCSKFGIHMRGNEMVVDTVCTIPRFFGHGGNTMTGHGVTHFSGNTAYHTEQTTHYDPPLNGKTD